MSILEIENLVYTYDNRQKVLKNISVQMEQGKMYAILGPSGCGKTTLLSLLGGLDSPTKGKILYNGEDIEKTGLANHRKKNVAFIFQSYNLIDYLTPIENVQLTSKLPALPILEQLGLTKEETRRNVLKLSGGQQQRVAIARALASDANIILADEPTGNLDSKSSRTVIEAFENARKQLGATIFMVTHDSFAASFCDRVILLKDGAVYDSLTRTMTGSESRDMFQDRLLAAIKQMSAIEGRPEEQ